MATFSYSLAVPPVIVLAVAVASGFGGTLSDMNAIDTRIRSARRADIIAAVSTITAELRSDPGRTVDRLNEQWMVSLLKAKEYDAVLEFSAAGTIALPADTWRIEQLHRHRVRAFLELGRPKEALSAAKGLYNVAGIGFMPTALELMAECLKAAHPEDPGIGNRFKLQQLAGAQTDPKEREKALKDLGESIMDKIEVDPKPWEKAIQERQGKEEYRTLYGTGNLLLLAGRTREAREVFEKVHATAPPREVRYASEGLVKAIKAEAGIIGPANAWILSVRPKE